MTDVNIAKLVSHLARIPSKEIAKGVAERTLISPDTTGSVKAVMKHYILESGAKLALDLKQEAILFALSGEGVASVNLIPRGYESSFSMEADIGAWLPPGSKANLESTGEGPLRCLLSYCIESPPGTTTEEPKVVSVSRVPVTPLTKAFGIEERILFGKNLLRGQMWYFEVDRFPMRCLGMWHTHSTAEQCTYITRGYARMLIGKERVDVTPGSIVYIPPNIEHNHENIGSDFLEYIVMMGKV